MSNVEINQVLQQMRAMSAEASGAKEGSGVESGQGLDFGEIIKNSLDEVSEAQSEAKSIATAFESGSTDVDLPEMMVALQKANVSFQAITQVRNKLLSAYQEVMNMQV